VSLACRVFRYISISALAVAAIDRADAATFMLPPDGTISIIGNLPASYNPSLFGPVQIEIQAIENISLPNLDPSNPSFTVGVYQWIADFSVLNGNGVSVPEPTLSPYGTALTGYGQNCFVVPACPNPSGESSETILSGALYISDDALTLQIATEQSGINVLSSDLELQVTLPDGLSITPIPGTLPLFAGGLAFVGYLAKRRKKSATPAFAATQADKSKA
jgi:hypothetical protein